MRVGGGAEGALRFEELREGGGHGEEGDAGAEEEGEDEEGHE